MTKQNFTVKAGLCLVGCLHLVAFTSLLLQLPYLYGRHGVQPVSTALASVQQQLPAGRDIRPLLSLVSLHGSLGITAEAMLALVCSVGWLLSVAVSCGMVHPLMFTALWMLYLSFVSLGGSFVDHGDEVLVEVCFAAIWLAIAHKRDSKVQHPQSDSLDKDSQQLADVRGRQQTTPVLSKATLMLFKWLLFRLLVVTSTLSATVLCGDHPVLASCFRAVAAHGHPHGGTWTLQTLPKPLAAAAAAVLLLELPAAFLVLVYIPALQFPTAACLLVLQLLRITLGPASLANLAATVLCFILLDDTHWVPSLLKLGHVVDKLKQARGSSSKQEHEHMHKPMQALSRSSSCTSLVSEGALDEGPNSQHVDELGASFLDNISWTPWLVGLAGVSVMLALLVTYDSQAGLMLRPQPSHLHSIMRVAVPLAMLVWAVGAGVACWQALQASWATSRAALPAEPRAAPAAQPLAPHAIVTPAQTAPASPEAPSPVPQANGPLANGVPANGDAANAGNAEQQEPVQPAGAAGDGAATSRSKAHARSTKLSKAEHSKSSKARSARGAAHHAGAAATANQGPGPAFEGLKPTSQDHGPSADTPVSHAEATANGGPAAPSAAASAPPSPAAAVAAAAAVPLPAAGGAKQDGQPGTAARTAGFKLPMSPAAVRAWAPAAVTIAVVAAVLLVFVAGAPQLLTAFHYRQDNIGHYTPGPLLSLSRLARSVGFVSSSKSCKSAYLATKQAAAAHGPGSIVQFEAFVRDEGPHNWATVPLKHTLQSTQLHWRRSWWQALLGGRGWCQMRLQAKMAAAALDSEQEAEPWVVLLADKVVQGSEDLVGLLDVPVRQHDYVTVRRVAYNTSTNARGPTLDAQSLPAAVPVQNRSSTYLSAVTQSFQAAPGDDGWFMALLERLARSLHGPLVLAGLLLIVVMRHLLFPGGLLQECQQACTAAT